ncbi:MAG: septum site-determining protein MinC [Pseudomonadota bacterium]|nr:septum site-determining protein MinC [Pseudomonadota bacterium]MDP1904079.1 septum site-determining protein MinC [Pseudomonadota bacterium]MDP2354194.1 septum site-determining protein MinC [Pseudomonadota bacterium]
MPKETPALKIKNANLPLFVLHAMTPDMDQFKQQLEAHLAKMPDFFASAPVALGLAAIADVDATPDFADLAAFMRQRGMAIAGIIGGSEQQRRAAQDCGLGLFPEARAARKVVEAEPEIVPEVAPEAEPEVVTEVLTEVAIEEAAETPPTRRPTLVIDKPVRTGQRIHAEGGDLVVLAIVNAGAELIADGDIHVYAPLRGRALAGARGDTAARIYAQCMEAELVSIAGYFQVFEDGIPAAQRSKPVQVFLDGESIKLAALGAVR